MERRNNFDFIRVLAALAVLVSHAWPIHNNTFPLGDLGAFGVLIFFAISGYLVSASWERDPNAARFLIRRGLRIFPALICAILVAAFIIGPIVTTLHVRQYFSDPLLREYVRSISLFPISFSLPGVFHANPYPNEVNGSLWTLPMEVMMYIGLVALSSALRPLRINVVPVWVALLLCAYAFEAKGINGITWYMDWQSLYRNGSAFVTGALLWQLRGHVRLVSWAWFPVCAFLIASRGTPVETWGLLLLVPYAAVAFSNACYPVVCRFGRFGDPSYGLYVYAFLIQQTLMFAFPAIHMRWFLIGSIVLSVAAGYLSWHLLEKRALHAKDFLGLGKPAMSAPTPS